MKRVFIILGIVLFCFSSLYSQKLKKKSITGSTQKEVYFYKKVKGEGKVKEGEYNKYLINNNFPTVLIQKGFYSNGKKAGVWTHYNFDGDSIFAVDVDKDSILYINQSANRLVCKYTRKAAIREPYYVGNDYKGTTYIFQADPKKINVTDTCLPIYKAGDIEFYNRIFKSVLDAISFYIPDNRYSPNYLNNFNGIITLKLNKHGVVERIDVPYTSEPSLKKIIKDKDVKEMKFFPAQINGENCGFTLAIPVTCITSSKEESYDPADTHLKREIYRFELVLYNNEWVDRKPVYRNTWTFK